MANNFDILMIDHSDYIKPLYLSNLVPVIGHLFAYGVCTINVVNVVVSMIGYDMAPHRVEFGKNFLTLVH